MNHNPMRRPVVSVWMTLDGVFDAAPAYFEQWFLPYHSDDRAQYIQETIVASEALLLGHVTPHTDQARRTMIMGLRAS